MTEAALTDRVETLKKQVAHYETRLVQAEEAYTKRSKELRKATREAEAELTRVQARIKAYEDSEQATREADKDRAKDLAKREQELKAGWRSLNQKTQDFEGEKTRFYQTRDLQS